MALQGALFIVGLLVLAAVFWFSGGRELVEQKRAPRVRRRASAAGEESAKEIAKEAERQEAATSINVDKKASEELAQMPKRQPERKKEKTAAKPGVLEKISEKISDRLNKKTKTKETAKRKKTSSWFGRSDEDEPKLATDAKAVQSSNRQESKAAIGKRNTNASLWGDNADELEHYKGLDALEGDGSQGSYGDQHDDQYGYGFEDDYVADQTAPAPDHDVPEYLRVGADRFNGVRVDYFATVTGDVAATLHEIMGVYQQTEFELNKNHEIYGLDPEDGRWRNLKNEFESERLYDDIALTLQLADRDGPVNQSNLTRFSSLVLRVSEALDRKFRFSSSFEDALEHAQNLDEFCQEYDVVAAIYVLARDGGSFAGLEVDAAARANSLYLGYKDIYHHMAALNGSSYSIFSMANMHNPGTFDEASLDITETQGLVFFINMPCTPNPAEAYQSMVIAAEAVCDELDGILVDQHRKAVNRKSLDGVRQQIDQIAQDMRGEGLSPGSVEAMRLFG